MKSSLSGPPAVGAFSAGGIPFARAQPSLPSPFPVLLLLPGSSSAAAVSVSRLAAAEKTQLVRKAALAEGAEGVISAMVWHSLCHRAWSLSASSLCSV